MHVFKTNGYSVVRDSHGEGGIRLLNDGAVYRFEGQGFQLLSYEAAEKPSPVQFKGESLWPVFGEQRKEGQRWRAIKKGEIWFEAEDGQKRQIAPLAGHLLLEGHGDPQGIQAAIVYGYPKRRQRSLVRLDVQTGEMAQRVTDEDGYRYYSPEVVGEDCYCSGYNEQCRVVVKFGHRLAKVWEHCFPGNRERPSTIKLERGIEHQDTLIFNLWMRFDDADELRRDGEVYCFAQEDGAVVWRRQFEWQVDDLVRRDEQTLLAAVRNRLFLLDANSGEVRQCLDTGLESRDNSFVIQVAGAYVFLFSVRQPALQIYERDTLGRVRDVNLLDHGIRLPLGLSVTEVAGRLFVSVYTDDMDGLLVIDLNDVQAPVSFEEEPPITIDEPGPDDGALVLTVADAPLGQVLRLAEAYAFRHAFHHGANGLGKPGNPFFSGQVLLRYRGCPEDPARARAWLDVLKTRFERKAQREGQRLHAAKSKAPVWLDYELV